MSALHGEVRDALRGLDHSEREMLLKQWVGEKAGMDRNDPRYSEAERKTQIAFQMVYPEPPERD